MRPPAPFVVGASRSGTTMLRLMLDAHPLLAIPPETHFIPSVAKLCATAENPAAVALDAIIDTDRWPSFGLDPDALRGQATAAQCESLSDVLRVFYASYAGSRDKPRWGDKTPFYVLAMPLIARLLAEAHFIHIIRDGRDVALSVIPLWWGPGSVPEAAAWWADRVRRGRRAGADLPYLEVRYEQLVEQPETELRRICAFIALDFDGRMLGFDERVREQPDEVAPHLLELTVDAAVAAEPEHQRRPVVSPREMQARLAARLSGPPDAASVGRWRSEMSATDLRQFDEIAGDLLAELGYPRS
jgi:Sulfotransferase family